ncbi:nitroreductase family protein [Isobaculum melis]|uniref:Nitroreductase domain-containing protein n=1 Tax=Isobaculum melis TaxID=142588 RepID=A0A1H9QS73_9LACT|nr:nitroreductase family protein [Isobaculum melis]SER63326.1 hypothetical protein SAMN04488559_102253 [Isobaculum melis]
MLEIKEFLTNRQSIRSFDESFEITNNEIIQILDEAATAPSSNNLQPWKVVAVKNKKIQKKISEFAFGQTAVKEASVVFILFADMTKYDDIAEVMKRMVNHGFIDSETAAKQCKIVEDFFQLHPKDKKAFGAALDTGLFAMNLIHIIRTHGYGTVPMRGALFTDIQEYLKLPSHWLPIMLLPIGKARLDGYQSIRYAATEFSKIIE